MKIGIMGAMIQEVELIKATMEIENEETIAGRVFISGKLEGFDTVLVFSRWGKVASSSTATTLFNRYNIDFLLFTGVAGAVDSTLNIGDVVIGEKLYQHDMDATPLFPKFHIPLTTEAMFFPKGNHVLMAEIAANAYIKTIHSDLDPIKLKQFSMSSPKVVRGTIATGDQFVKDMETHKGMNISETERAHAVEMEGAAVAQVCEEYHKPYIIVRTISDKADHSATIDFLAFIENISNHYSKGIVSEFLSQLRHSITEVGALERSADFSL